MNTESMGWRVVVDAPAALAYAVLRQDRVWNCFAIADLTPPFRAYTQIAVASRTDPPGDAACLVLRHPALTVISPFGSEQGVAAILAQLDLPDTALVQAHDAEWPLFAPYYRFLPDRQELLRLSITARTFQEPPPGAGPVPARLTAADLPALRALYDLYPASTFRADQLEHGVFYGLRIDGRLVAVAGTHVLAPAYGLAVLGGIFTHPAARRRGYGRAVTAALVRDLLAQGCRDVVLNVGVDNDAALRLYTHLGFQRHDRYWTGRVERRQGREPDE
jgi:ribosomal protein S18 acetylase RimI-like enzyme